VTLTCDKVMMLIPGHLRANQECYGVEEFYGHEFIRSYMRNANSEYEVFRDTEFYLKILGALDSQWKITKEPNHFFQTWFYLFPPAPIFKFLSM